ncbi:MAG TPA: hypothetical protein VK659_24375 [Asanoa sp.]|nr:hypothetical protein [Asanoa sp.]
MRGGSRSGSVRRKKCSTSGMMSSARSRSGGRCSVQPATRWKKSLRKVPLACPAARSRLVAQISRNALRC